MQTYISPLSLLNESVMGNKHGANKRNKFISTLGNLHKQLAIQFAKQASDLELLTKITPNLFYNGSKPLHINSQTKLYKS